MTVPAEDLPKFSPRTDLIGGLVWIALGAIVIVLSWQMDRFESQGGTLYTAPGAWPAVVGMFIAVLGGVLILRARRRAAQLGWNTAQVNDAELVPRREFGIAVALIFIYALLMVGRGLPFWLVTFLFVTLFVALFRRFAGHPMNARGMLFATICGAATAAAVTLAFQELFFVRLP